MLVKEFINQNPLMAELLIVEERLQLIETVVLPSITDDQTLEDLTELVNDISRRYAIANKAFGITNKFKDKENRKKYRKMALVNLNKIRALLRKLDKKIAELNNEEVNLARY